jgi:predicted DNA-binding transcriptional regulator AlpA
MGHSGVSGRNVATPGGLVLVPDPQVWREFGVTPMTGWRWTHDKALKFPQPIKIRNRCFRSRSEIEEFKERMMREGVQRRAVLSQGEE